MAAKHQEMGMTDLDAYLCCVAGDCAMEEANHSAATCKHAAALPWNKLNMGSYGGGHGSFSMESSGHGQSRGLTAGLAGLGSSVVSSAKFLPPGAPEESTRKVPKASAYNSRIVGVDVGVRYCHCATTDGHPPTLQTRSGLAFGQFR